MNEFWKTMDLLDWKKEGNDDLVLLPLITYLSEQSDEKIFAFEDKMAQLLYELDDKNIAFDLYNQSYISPDLFLYQRCVAIVNGKTYYDAIKDRKTKLDPNLEFESILYVAMKAWAKKHQQEIENYPHIPNPSYETYSNHKQWE